MHLNSANQVDREGLESNFLRISGHSAKLRLSGPSGLFIANLKFKNNQKEFCIRPGSTPEETFRSALLQETGYATAST